MVAAWCMAVVVGITIRDTGGGRGGGGGDGGSSSGSGDGGGISNGGSDNSGGCGDCRDEAVMAAGLH